MPEAGNEAGRFYFVQKLGDPKKSEDREFHPDGNQIGNCRHDAAERNHLRFHLGLPLKHRHGGDPGYDQRDQGDDSHAVNDVRPGTQKIAEQCNDEDRDQIFEPAAGFAECRDQQSCPDDAQQQTLQNKNYKCFHI